MSTTWKPGEIGWREGFGYGIYVPVHTRDHGRGGHMHTQSGGWNPASGYTRCVVLRPESDADIRNLINAIDGTPTNSGLSTREQRRVHRAREVLRSMANPPTEVYEHLVESVDAGVGVALCGKVWRINQPNTTVVGKCPNCQAAVREGWIA